MIESIGWDHPLESLWKLQEALAAKNAKPGTKSGRGSDGTVKIPWSLAFQWERRWLCNWACHEQGCFSSRQVLKCINISVLVLPLFSKGKFFTLSHGLKFLFLGVPKLASNITGLTQVCRTQPGLPQFSGSVECVIHHQMKQHKCYLSYLSFIL